MSLPAPGLDRPFPRPPSLPLPIQLYKPIHWLSGPLGHGLFLFRYANGRHQGGPVAGRERPERRLVLQRRPCGQAVLHQRRGQGYAGRNPAKVWSFLLGRLVSSGWGVDRPWAWVTCPQLLRSWSAWGGLRLVPRSLALHGPHCPLLPSSLPTAAPTTRSAFSTPTQEATLTGTYLRRMLLTAASLLLHR